jgi:GT2 family glycosyltransferase
VTVDIVIVNWNSGTQLQECIESVRSYHSDLVGKCTDVDLILTGQNLGFGKACNLGAARGSADFVLFLNPDAKLLQDSLRGVHDAIQEPANEAVGIVGVQLIGEDGAVQRTCARSPTMSRLLCKSLGISALIKSTDFQMREWAHAETRKVDQVIGAFFCIRRDLFSKLGGFDERFFVYFEEVDLSYRVSQLGYHSLYVADVQAFHKGGGVSEQVKAHRLFYSLRSRILYAFKHFSVISAAMVMFATLILEPVSRLIFLVMRGRVLEIRDLAKGYKMLWGWFFAQALRGRLDG